MKIYLIRHGQTDWNIQGKIQGSHDIPLNETGYRQAQMLAKGMSSRTVKRIFASPLIRAAETAKALGKEKKVDVCFMPKLVEVEFGKWEGLTWAEIKKEYPKEYEQWSLNSAEATPPGGETQNEIIKRCTEALKEIISLTGGEEDTAIVSHGATLAHLFSYMMRNSPEIESMIVENASITTINYNPLTEDFTLLELNDTSHFHG